MDIKEASEAVIELMKLEKVLEPTCETCENCKTLKLVKDEIINLSSYIVYEQARRIITLSQKLAGKQNDSDIDKSLEKLSDFVNKKVGPLSSTQENSVTTAKKPNNGNGNSNLN